MMNPLWVLTGLPLLTASVASAAPMLQAEAFDNGVAISVSPTSTATGFLSFFGSDSFFNVVSGSATGAPIETDPNFQSNTLDVSASGFTAARTLRVLISQTGLSSTATNFASTFTLNSLIGNVTSSVITDYLGTNAFDETTPIGSATFGSTVSSAGPQTTTVAHATPFSETVEFDFNFGISAAVSTASASAAITGTAVPEPTTASLLAFTAVAGTLGRRRRAARSGR